MKKKAKCVKQKSEDEDSVFGKGTSNTKNTEKSALDICWILTTLFIIFNPLLNILANWELWVYCSSIVFATHFIKAMTFAREYSTDKTLLPCLFLIQKMRGSFLVSWIQLGEQNSDQNFSEFPLQHSWPARGSDSLLQLKQENKYSASRLLIWGFYLCC